MKSLYMKIPALAILTVTLILITSCEEGSKINTRKNRLLSESNYRLKQQIEVLKTEIENQKELLGKCEQEKIEFSKQANDSATFLMTLLPQQIMQENVQMQQEIQQLKEQIQQLKAQPQTESTP